jgi:integrase
MTQQRLGSFHVPGGRQLVGTTHATLESPLHPLAQEAKDDLLHSTDSHAGKPRRVSIVQNGVKRQLRTSLSDEEILTIAASLKAPEDANRPSPGHADLGENPFDTAVAKAVAAHLAQLGINTTRPALPASPHSVQALYGYPAARRTNRHIKLAADFAWDEPSDGNASLASRVERYLQFIEARELTYGYTKEHEAAFRVLLEVVGDKPTGKISVNDMDDVIDAITGMPKHFSTKEEYRDLTIPDMVRKAGQLGAELRQLNSQQRLVTVLRTFFIWLESRNEARPGLLLGVKLFRPGRDFGGQRDWFDLDDIEVLFDPKREAKFAAPWQTWALRLALFAGMRQLEIAQLLTDDIQKVDGIWCIDIAPDKKSGKRVKNQASHRKTPIHDRFIAAGFLDYVNQARAAGVTRLFPDLKPNKGGVGRRLATWFTTYVRKHCEIESKAKTFHSLRHTFATLADRSGLRDEHIMKLLGHDWGKTLLRKVYAQELNLREKHQQLHRIEFPDVKMTPHDSMRYLRYFRAAYAEQTRKARLDATYGVTPSRSNPRKR